MQKPFCLLHAIQVSVLTKTVPQYFFIWYGSVIGKCTLLPEKPALWRISIPFQNLLYVLYNHNLLWKQSSKKRTFKSTILPSRIKIDLFSFLMEGKRKQSDAFSAKRKFLPFHKKLHSFIKFKKKIVHDNLMLSW